MKTTPNYATVPAAAGKVGRLRRLTAIFLAIILLITTAPAALGEAYADTNLCLYYAEATIEEGKASGNADQFFANIAAIAMTDVTSQDFYLQLADAVDSGNNYRVFVMHEKGMPATDLAMLYCFRKNTWLVKDPTTLNGSVYLDASWEVLQGLDLQLKRQDLVRGVTGEYDELYECKPEMVWQTFMEFVLFIEERNKAIDQMLAGTTDQIPEMPEEITRWPLEMPISVQLPKELTILSAEFTVEPAESAAAYYDDVPDSKRFEGTVGEDNLVTGTLLFWESGPHLVRLVFLASINGHNQSLCHNISIDTSSVRLAEQETCPLYEDGHQWRYDWAEEHPHTGRYVCSCGAVMEDPEGAPRVVLDCCECGFHDWGLSYYIWEGKARMVGKCRQCGIYKDMSDEMPDYVRSYLELLVKNGAEGNTYFDEHSTGNTFYSRDTAPWVYIANQSLNRYTDAGTALKESFVTTLADPIVTGIQLQNGQYEEKLNIYSKAQLKWIELIQEMVNEGEEEIPMQAAKDFVGALDITVDGMTLTYDAQTEWLKSLAAENFSQNVSEFEEALRSSQATLETLKSTTSDTPQILAQQDKVNRTLSSLEALKQKGPDTSLYKSTAGSVCKFFLPHIMNGISAYLEGSEAAAKVEEMRQAYTKMLDDYNRSRTILDALKTDAAVSGNRDLENAVDTIISVLDATFLVNAGNFADASFKIMKNLEEEMETTEDVLGEAGWKAFDQKEHQTVIMALVDLAFDGVSPIAIANISAKILKGVTNYDEIFDASMDLVALSSMRQKASLSLLEANEQVSPYTLALYAKLESEGCEQAAEFVSTLSTEDDIDNIMRRMIEGVTMFSDPALSLYLRAVDAMEVDVRDFGIGSDEKESVILMLQNEKESYDRYVRQCMHQDWGN